MIFWAMLSLFVVVTLIFVIITLLFPEWVGITGKVALEYQRQQRGDPPAAEEVQPAESPIEGQSDPAPPKQDPHSKS